MRSRYFGVGLWVGLVCLAGCVTQVTERQRATAKINYDMGVQNLSRGEMREALRQLLIARRLDPRLPEAQQALGLVYHSMHRLDDALIAYKEAIRLRPTFSEAYNNLGALYIDRGEYKAAIRAFNIALEDILYTTPALAEGNLGWAYFKAGDIAAANEHLGNAVAGNPEFCCGHEWLLRVARSQKQDAAALAHGRRLFRHCLDQPAIAATTQPGYRAEMAQLVAEAEEKAGHVAEARALYRRCLESGDLDDAEVARTAVVCKAALARLESG